ncbi:hypothetical protein [Aquicella lusitana]|uniref:Uncharacterized protein n=1 Tax=Aquicella lusitana TaxID=254246 RepID=A0A370G5E5_9COXI|nr:hypothetical protein [Aquicella lusitana]RDI37273.1 hypothetical protein C8D86_1405 [Aquicella lusitana]VVC73646.1 hypothetical protein AQULUS_13930 [Aquicella lusitana]
MPEIVTKHPDIVLQLLKDAGIKCGQGEKQQILRSCPKESFCALPTGELCVFGVKNIASMTQMTAADFTGAPREISMLDWPNAVLIVVVFILGMLVGRIKRRKINR